MDAVRLRQHFVVLAEAFAFQLLLEHGRIELKLVEFLLQFIYRLLILLPVILLLLPLLFIGIKLLLNLVNFCGLLLAIGYEATLQVVQDAQYVLQLHLLFVNLL